MTVSPGLPEDLPEGLPEDPHEELPVDHAARFPEALPPTERRNPRTVGIDVLPTLGVLELLNDEDGIVAGAVRAMLGDLARVVDEAADRVSRGGRVHYFGAGSSGRIAVLDATELAPTFGLPPGVVVAHLAGGAKAMTRAVEGAEDDEDCGRADAAGVVGHDDVVIGLAASGRTPYVAGVLNGARDKGAFTAVVTSDPGSRLLPLADVGLVAETGPEAIAGSTRMKATTAMKLILNSFSTALMIRLGRTYSNLMVGVSASNTKLRGRKVRILGEASGEPKEACASALTEADGDLRLAMVMLLGGVSVDVARQALETVTTEDGHGSVRAALGILLRFRKEMPPTYLNPQHLYMIIGR